MDTSPEKFRIDYTRRVRTRTGNHLKQIEQFHAKIKIDSPESCWIWTDALDKDGYGKLRISKHKFKKAHRLSYELYKGNIPQGYLICHHCDNPSCVNPEHLFLGLPKDNMRDMYNKGRYVNGNLKLSSKDLEYIKTYPKVYGSGRLLAQFFNVHEGHITRIRKSA